MLKKAILQRKLRRFHRWFGFLIGIQFLFWTIGGIYFSWSDMDEVHGDHQKAHIHPMGSRLSLQNPQLIIDKIRQKDTVNFIFEVKLIQILGKPFYQVVYSKEHDRNKKIQVADAATGELRGSLSKEEAIQVARKGFISDAKVEEVTYLTETDRHHEYREQALPAFAVTFEHPSRTTVYVATELGTIQKFRNKPWRIFDFFWMLHTMDFESRDNISNGILRAFSILGLLTILSGFALFFLTLKSPKMDKKEAKFRK